MLLKLPKSEINPEASSELELELSSKLDKSAGFKLPKFKSKFKSLSKPKSGIFKEISPGIKSLKSVNFLIGKSKVM